MGVGRPDGDPGRLHGSQQEGSMDRKQGFDFDSWVARNAARIGVREDDLRRAFAGEAAGEASPDDVLEVPDLWRATYRYSYGGVSRFFREIRDGGRLLGTRCPSCGRVYCPPRIHCPWCYEDTRWEELTGTGEVMTFTTVHFGTSAFRRYPFVVAYVRLDGTDSVLCVIIEMEDVSRARVGMKVKAVFRDERDGRITDLFFEPLDEAAGELV